MTLLEQLNADLRESMRSGDETRKSTLRMLIAAVRNASIPPEHAAGEAGERVYLSEEAVLDIVRKEVKQRRDSIDAYRRANRPDLVVKEEAEASVLAAYLPPQMSREQIVDAARRVIDQVNARGPADKGKVMPPLIAELKDRAEGREINAVVTELLAGL